MKLSPTLFLLLGASSILPPGVAAQEIDAGSSLDDGEVAQADFLPLECNEDIELYKLEECKSWVNASYDFEDKVEIPCGMCVVFDEPPDSHIVLEGGLSVRGRLVFPLNTKATIETPFIFIEGLLEASSNQTVNSTNMDGLHFIMTGTDDQPFFPDEENKASCAGYFCHVGKKPVVVAGGRLDIQGINETCPTWVKLLDVARDQQVVPKEFPLLPVAPPNCAHSVINDNFENGLAGHFKSSLGSKDSIENEDGNNYFRVARRTRSWQGAFINVHSFLRECMIIKQTYLIRARYRLIQEGDYPSNCQTNGVECLSLNMHTMSNDESPKWKTLYETPPAAKSTDGVWTDFVAMLEFEEIDLDPTALYQVLYFSGPEGGIGIDIDDISISLPWEAHFPIPDDNVCTNLIVNGDAEVDDIFAYPFELIGNIGSYLKVNHETVDGVRNNYFSVTGRNATWTSIYQGLIQDCIVEHTVYTFKFRVRIHSDEPSTLNLVLKTTKDKTKNPEEDYEYESIGECPPASIHMGWVWCERVFLFTDTHQSASKVEVQIMAVDNPNSDIDYDDVSIAIHSLPVNKFILSSDVALCWGVGAQIVQTSHTISHSDFNELNITDITIVNDTAVVSLGSTIAKPTTAVDDPRFAVEVALLSRNIAMTSKDDDPGYPNDGPHMMILHTPNVTQSIIGIDFRGFGQQGTEARYPVHFHMCGNVTGTIVARNTVRHSHQRCYVVHATDNVKLEYNIAFDTFGHCYMLEDGIEEENSFFHNLGLETKITPDDGLISIAESDQFAATFWAANPRNYFLGNIAAGSEDNGFWYEFLETVRGVSMKLDPTYSKNPTQIPMGYHRKNVMHSNAGEGFKLYPNGYFPEDRALFEDVMSFRNHGDGVLLHNSKNLGLEGGVFADNRRGIEVDKQADDVTVSNAVVIGFSDLYRIDVEAGNRQSHCPAWLPLVGIQLHSFLRYRDSKGYILTNVTFENFGEETGCIGSVAIEMDEQVRDGHFDAFSSFHNLTFPAGSPVGERFNMCSLEKNPMFLHDLIIQDDGSLNPASINSPFKSPGVIVSNSEAMVKFNDNCVEMKGSCALYCDGDKACYRGLNIATWNTADYEDLFLEVTDSNGNVYDISGYFDEKEKDVVHTINNRATLVQIPDVYENTSYQRRRYYSPILPYGKYTMRFKMKGLSYWPQFVETIWEDSPACSQHIDDSNVALSVPEPTESDCSNIIRNPGGETGGYDFWAHTGGAMDAIAGGALSGSYTIASVNRTGAWHGLGQFMDTRCLTIGRQYEIIVNIRLQDKASKEYINCNINQLNYNAIDVCPRVVFRARKLKGNKIGDGVDTLYAYPMASAVGPWEEDTWNILYGRFTVSETFAQADSVFFNIERTRPGVNLIMDDISVQPTSYDCYVPIYNRNFEIGDTRFWGSIGNADIAIYSPGYSSTYALRTTKRDEFWASMSQELDKDCLVEGDKFTVSAMILLLDGNENVYDCTIGLLWGEGSNGRNFVCPTMSLRIVYGTSATDIDIGSIPGPIQKGNWNSIHGQFDVDASIMEADYVSIYFRKVKEDVNIVVDNISITKAASTASPLIVNNADFSVGDVRYYNLQGGGLIGVTSPGYDDDYAMIVHDRTREDYGVNHIIDNNSLVAEAIYKISCQIKLVLNDLTTPFYCDPKAISGDMRCPTFSLRSHTTGLNALTRLVAAAPPLFQKDQWNKFSGIFQFLALEIQAESLSLIINNAPTNIVMLIDNIEIDVQDLSSTVPSTSPSLSSMPSTAPSSSTSPSLSSMPSTAPSSSTSPSLSTAPSSTPSLSYEPSTAPSSTASLSYEPSNAPSSLI